MWCECCQMLYRTARQRERERKKNVRIKQRLKKGVARFLSSSFAMATGICAHITIAKFLYLLFFSHFILKGQTKWANESEERKKNWQKAPATNYLYVQQQWNRIDFPSVIPSSITTDSLFYGETNTHTANSHFAFIYFFFFFSTLLYCVFSPTRIFAQKNTQKHTHTHTHSHVLWPVFSFKSIPIEDTKKKKNTWTPYMKWSIRFIGYCACFIFVVLSDLCIFWFSANAHLQSNLDYEAVWQADSGKTTQPNPMNGQHQSQAEIHTHTHYGKSNTQKRPQMQNVHCTSKYFKKKDNAKIGEKRLSLCLCKKTAFCGILTLCFVLLFFALSSFVHFWIFDPFFPFPSFIIRSRRILCGN